MELAGWEEAARTQRGAWGVGPRLPEIRSLVGGGGVGVERDRKGWLTFNALDHPKILSNRETL